MKGKKLSVGTILKDWALLIFVSIDDYCIFYHVRSIFIIAEYEKYTHSEFIYSNSFYGDLFAYDMW